MYVQIENNKLYFRERARSKCGSLDYYDHVPGGGDKKVMCNQSLLPLFEENHVDF